jgi:dipeptidyl aminopeptidase/acylaminoacyl peptidase
VSAAAPTELTPGTGFVEDVALSRDGQWLFYATNIGSLDDRDIWKVRTSGGEPQRLTSGSGLEVQPVVFGGGNRIAMLYADARRPLSVALLEADGSPHMVTPLPREFPAASHVVPSTVVLTSADSVVTHNQLFLPRDAKPGERHPALVFVHGGPQRQMLPGYHYMHFYHMAYAMNQYFASQGYVVLSVNYRSGIGYGRDFRTAPNVGRRGMSEYADVLAAAHYLLQRPDVDSSRIGIWGLSYGGILTAQGLARNSDIFKAGVDLAGVHSWGNPLDTAAVTYKSSAISQIDRWTSPVLLIHGDDDRNVSFSQTVGLVQALRARNIPYELIVYPDDVHDSLLFSRWLRSFHATDDFLRRHLSLTDHPSMRR